MTSQDKKKTRKPNWSGPDGRDSTITCLKTTLEPHFSELLSDDGKPYTSKDMQKGINTSQLSKFIVMLTSLMELDPRGGFLDKQMLMIRSRLSSCLKILKMSVSDVPKHAR